MSLGYVSYAFVTQVCLRCFQRCSGVFQVHTDVLLMLLSSEILVGTDTGGAAFIGHGLKVIQKELSIQQHPVDVTEKAPMCADQAALMIVGRLT